MPVTVVLHLDRIYAQTLHGDDDPSGAFLVGRRAELACLDLRQGRHHRCSTGTTRIGSRRGDRSKD